MPSKTDIIDALNTELAHVNEQPDVDTDRVAAVKAQIKAYTSMPDDAPVETPIVVTDGPIEVTDAVAPENTAAPKSKG